MGDYENTPGPPNRLVEHWNGVGIRGLYWGSGWNVGASGLKGLLSSLPGKAPTLLNESGGPWINLSPRWGSICPTFAGIWEAMIPGITPGTPLCGPDAGGHAGAGTAWDFLAIPLCFAAENTKRRQVYWGATAQKNDRQRYFFVCFVARETKGNRRVFLCLLRASAVDTMPSKCR